MPQATQQAIKERIEDLITSLHVQIGKVRALKWYNFSARAEESRRLFTLIREASAYMEHSTPLLPHQLAARLGYALGYVDASVSLCKIKEPKK